DEGLPQLVAVDQLEDRRRLAAGDDEGIDALQVGGGPDLAGLGSAGRQGAAVLRNVSLQRQDARPHAAPYHPRGARRSSLGTSRRSMPRIGSPRPRDTLAS